MTGPGRWAVVAAAQIAFLAAWLAFLLEVASGIGVEALWSEIDWSKSHPAGEVPIGYLPLFLVPVIFAPTIIGAVWADKRNRRRFR